MAWMMELASLIFLTDVVLLFSKRFHFNVTKFFNMYVCMCTFLFYVWSTVWNTGCSSEMLSHHFKFQFYG